MKPSGVSIPQDQVLAAVRNYFRGELLNRANGGTNGTAWLRDEVQGAVQKVLNADQGMLQRAVRQELASILGAHNFRSAVQQALTAEVARLVKERLQITATLDLSVDPDRYKEGAAF